MKKLFLMLLFIVGCNLPADNEPRNIIGVWDPNTEADMSYYRFHFWQGDDTTNWQPTMLEYLYDVPHSFIADSIMSDSISFVLNYSVIGATAVDSAGNESSMGYSRIYAYSEFFAPAAPESMRVEH